MFKIIEYNKFVLFQPFGTPISLSSKCLQLYTIMKFKNADSLSLTSWFISAYTNGGKFSVSTYIILFLINSKHIKINF